MKRHTTLTISDAANRLQISRPTIYHLIATGQLKTYKVGRRRFTTAEYIDAYIDRSTSKAAGR